MPPSSSPLAVPDPRAWVVMPLYNEEAMVGDVIDSLFAAFAHIVCVDDGSTDDSAKVATQAGAHVVRHPINLGQGAALQTGITFALAHSTCDYVVTFDADGQHRVDDAIGMVALARAENTPIIFGSRFLDDRTNPGLIKRFVLKTAVWVSNLTSGMRLTDAHNGLRVIRRDAAEAIDLKQDRMAHATEIVLELGRTGLPWREYPVHLLYTDYSKSKGQSVLNAVNILVDLVVK